MGLFSSVAKKVKKLGKSVKKFTSNPVLSTVLSFTPAGGALKAVSMAADVASKLPGGEVSKGPVRVPAANPGVPATTESGQRKAGSGVSVVDPEYNKTTEIIRGRR